MEINWLAFVVTCRNVFLSLYSAALVKKEKSHSPTVPEPPLPSTNGFDDFLVDMPRATGDVPQVTPGADEGFRR